MGPENQSSFRIRSRYVDIDAGRIFPAEVTIEQGRIAAISEIAGPVEGFIMPGFIDSHVHVESSMLVPSEFARLAVTHGTVATISDPHEIANVLGMEGVDFMIDNGAKVPFHFFFGVPSCVPATAFETAGAALGVAEVERLLARDEVRYLSEMMNFPGVLNNDAEVMGKIAAAHAAGKPVDGHAPGLRGEDVVRYAAAGISTDHECFTAEEALDKLRAGMWVQVREGSAAKNFEALAGLLHEHHHRMMFCSDDKHPDGLVEGHIDRLCARAVARGIDLFKVLRVACLNPIEHYRLPVGRLRTGDPADMIMVEDLASFRNMRTYIRGELVAEAGRSLIGRVDPASPNRFNCSAIDPRQLVQRGTSPEVLAIKALDGQLITLKQHTTVLLRDGILGPSVANDVLKIAVVNRYADAPPAVGWITGFGLQRGALAGSVAHDSHNIVAVGTNDADITNAINAVIRNKGGISLADGGTIEVLPLPVGGIMSNADAYTIAKDYAELDRAAKGLGSPLGAPFMTLSFMALLVIPHLKMSDKGLFDGDAFHLTGAMEHSEDPRGSG